MTNLSIVEVEGCLLHAGYLLVPVSKMSLEIESVNVVQSPMNQVL